jgi:hypothetical protein
MSIHTTTRRFFSSLGSFNTAGTNIDQANRLDSYNLNDATDGLTILQFTMLFPARCSSHHLELFGDQSQLLQVCVRHLQGPSLFLVLQYQACLLFYFDPPLHHYPCLQSGSDQVLHLQRMDLAPSLC